MAKDIENKSKKEGKHFFKDFKAELKKVIWPTPKQVVNNTVAVITIVLITALIVFALDFVFKAINTYGIDSIRSIVNKDENTTTDTTDEESEEGNTIEASGSRNEDGSELEFEINPENMEESSEEDTDVEEDSEEETDSEEVSSEVEE